MRSKSGNFHFPVCNLVTETQLIHLKNACTFNFIIDVIYKENKAGGVVYYNQLLT